MTSAGTVAPGTPGVPAEDRDRLVRLLAPLGVASGVELLTGGTFATTYRATMGDGERVVVKTAPTATDGLLTYERDLVRTEAEVYALAADRPDLLMPRVLLTDFSRTVLPGDAVVVTHLRGTPLTALDAGGPPDPGEAARRHAELGGYMARLHTITGPRFGYPNAACGLVGATWPEAFGRMVEAVLADGARRGVTLPADAVLGALARHRAALAEVRVPRLVHTDLWAGNLFVDPASRRLCGVIDTERSVWGDPLLELAGTDELSRGPVPAALVDGYRAAGGDLPLGTPGGETRLLLCRLYIALVLVVVTTARGYEGDWVPGYRTACEDNVAAALAALDVPA